VRDLPALNTTIQKLVRDIKWINPSGTEVDYEWLKKPTQLTYAGNGKWNLVERWIGAPTWSVIYGGTFGAPTP
jgi:hypothetical protein